MGKTKLLTPAEAGKAEQQMLHALERQQEEIEAELGQTAIDELTWIVDLSQRSLSHLEALDQWRWLYFYAQPAFRYLLIETRIPTKSDAQKKVVADIEDAISTVKTLTGGLADGKVVNLSPESGTLTLNIRQDAKGRLSREYRGPLETQVFFRTLDLLDRVGNRLRRCPYQPEGEPVCGRVFVKRKGQRFCKPDHAQAAAYDAWVKRGMPRGRKGGKTR